MIQFFIITLRSGLRSRSIRGVLFLGLMLLACAFLAASFSPRHPKTVALDVGFSGIRICLILLGLLWIQEFIGRELERKTILFSLTYPVARASYLLGRFLGIAVLLALAVCMLGVFLQFAVRYAGGEYQQGFAVDLGLSFWAVLGGLWCDAMLVCAFGLLLTLISTVSFLPLVLGLLFAVAGKGLGFVVDYLAAGADGDRALLAVYQPLINVIKWVLPDLSRYDLRVWPMYGIVPESAVLFWTGVMFLAYLAVLVTLAVVVFDRREINL